MTDEERIRNGRIRLRDDFPFYAANALVIRTKEGEIVPFILNRAQRRLAEVIERQYASEGKVRAIILKGRQMGLSTKIGGRIYSRVSQRKATKAIVVTHHADSTRALFDMTKRFHDQCPEVLKPSTRYSSRRELQFDGLDSGYTVATAGGDSIGRGETLTYAHLSELAFWPKSSAEANFNGLMQAIPNSPGTEVYIESTANGVSGLFYDTWIGAVRGLNGFIPVFLPWFYEPKYREVVSPEFERTPDEDELVLTVAERYDGEILDDEQLMYRRRKIAQNGVDLWNQEYPTFPEDAFLTTGRPVFNPYHLKVFGEGVEPIAKLALEGDKWVPHPRGEMLVYRKHDDAEQYYVGADVGMGVKRDWSVCQVLDGQRRQVATWRGQVDPAYFAEVIAALGTFWNQATVAVENNNHGVLTCYRLSKELNYQPLYQDVIVDKVTDTETLRVGFSTNVRTKPLIIDRLRAELRDGTIHLADKTTLSEMRTYIVTETGAMEAERGCFDDAVMSLAIANHVHEGSWVPVPTSDSDYATFSEE